MAYTTINKSTDYFETTTYTGGATDVSSLSFQPDFVWVKKRSGAEGHALFDAVRGVLKALKSDSANSEDTRSGSLTSFDNDGWSMGGTDGIISAPGSTYVGWSWKANGAGSANTDGSTATTVSVNTTAGFSIVKWTGTSGNTTIGHGLGVIPSVVIAKNTGGSGTNWTVYHKDLSSGYYVKLNLSNAQDNANAYFTADPTNSILSLTGNTAANSNGNNMIAYCFNDVQGYSKFGSYVGNGNVDGTFVYTGFKPAFVLAKKTNEANTSWIMLDNKRLTSFNPIEVRMFANLSSAEDDINTSYCDLVSNGFKIRKDDNNINDANDTYIYITFAEAPLVGTNGVTAKAR